MPHFWWLPSPRHLHLQQTRQCFFLRSLESFGLQTGVKACELLCSNYVALFKCSLSLLDVEAPVISRYLRTQDASIFLFFRCLVFLKILYRRLLFSFFCFFFTKSDIFFFRNKVKRTLWKNIYPFILLTGSVLVELARETKRMKVLLPFWFWGKNSQRTLWSRCWYRACIVEHWKRTEKKRERGVKC